MHKKIAAAALCLFLPFTIFPETVYKVSRTYAEKGDRTNETSKSTYYFVKNKNVLKTYRDENGRISKKIEMRALQHDDSILVMITHGQRMDSLYEIRFMEGGSITINGDEYVLEKESYDRLYANTMKKSNVSEMRIDTILSLFSMTPYFLIDGSLPSPPYDLFCDVERYKILDGRFSVQDPQSGMMLTHAGIYEYDENGVVASMRFRCETPDYGGVDYSLNVTKRNGNEILKKEVYSLFERMSVTSVIHVDSDKNECDMAGDYFAPSTLNEYTFSEIIRCEKMREGERELLGKFNERLST